MSLALALLCHACVTAGVLAYVARRLERASSLTAVALGVLALVHGAPLLVYLLLTGPETVIFEAALSAVNPESTLVTTTTAVSLSFVMMIAGVEVANLLLPTLGREGRLASRAQTASGLVRVVSLGPVAQLILWAVCLAMLGVSVAENQASKVFDYFASGESELGKILLRTESGGTPYYLYNLVLASVAPFLVMLAWAASGRRGGRWSLKLLACTLALAVLLGKFGTLSKAPPVIFALQLLVFGLLIQRRRLTLSIGLLLGSVALTLFTVIAALTIPDLDAAAVFAFLYYRVFDIPNEVLLEYFAAIPASLPHGLGAGLFAFLRPDNAEFIPMYSAVAEVTRDSLVSTSNAMFVGDAWAEFGWPGVLAFAAIAGFALRTIDLYAFRRGETDGSACLVAGGLYGVFTMLSTALSTAFITGGLAFMPLILAACTRATDRRSGKIMTATAKTDLVAVP